MINFVESNTIEFHFAPYLAPPNQLSSFVRIEIGHGIYVPAIIYVCKSD